MSSTSTGLTENRQHGEAQGQMGLGYYLTEEQMEILNECDRECFWYRSGPLSLTSMAITRALIKRGVLSASPKFGSLPKLAFAGFFGYMIGRISYMKTCQEKFKRYEESRRQESGMPLQYSKGAPSELSDPDTQSFSAMFQPAESPSQKNYRTESPLNLSRSDDFSTPAESYVEEEEEPRRKAILYEDLRLKNRENYEVTLTQKAETLLKTSPEKEPKRPKKEVKNKYGDTWDD